MIKLYSKRSLWGTHRTYQESLEYDKIIENVFEKSSKEVYGTKSSPEMAIFAYGSPGRFELTGGDSDADVFIAEPKRTEKGNKLRELLEQRWGNYNFSKVDIPSWGTFEEIELFLRTSLVEGNQVLETRFVCGNKETKEKVEEIIKEYDSPQREFFNIVFNRLYFNQYFKQRIVKGAPNIKYCSGGSREFLFFYWYDRLCNKLEGKDSSLSGLTQPKVKEGLERLFMEGAITGNEFGSAFEAVNFIIELRTDMLKTNKGTSKRGLTLLDDETILRLQADYKYPKKEEVLKNFREYSNAIKRVSRVIWNRTIDRASKFKGNYWKKQFFLACNLETPEEERRIISSEDTLLRTALIWGASESSQKTFLISSQRDIVILMIGVLLAQLLVVHYVNQKYYIILEQGKGKKKDMDIS